MDRKHLRHSLWVFEGRLLVRGFVRPFTTYRSYCHHSQVVNLTANWSIKLHSLQHPLLALTKLEINHRQRKWNRGDTLCYCIKLLDLCYVKDCINIFATLPFYKELFWMWFNGFWNIATWYYPVHSVILCVLTLQFSGFYVNQEDIFFFTKFRSKPYYCTLHVGCSFYYYYKNVNLSLICEPVVKIWLPVYDPSILYISLFIKHSSQAAW